MADQRFKADKGLQVAGGNAELTTQTTISGNVTVSNVATFGANVTLNGTTTFGANITTTSNGTLTIGASDKRVRIFAESLDLTGGFASTSNNADTVFGLDAANAGIIVKTGSGTGAVRTVVGSNTIVVTNGSGVSGNIGLVVPIQNGLFSNTTGVYVNASSISDGTLAISRGGTGAVSATAAIIALLPNTQGANVGRFLKAEASSVVWDPGVQGPIGFTGSQGPAGAGFTGSQGIPGVGFTGSQGNIGFTGSQGAGVTGFTGSQGNIGFTGSQGATGVGFTGSQGATGVGFTGSQGATGVGFTGSQGVGFTGSQGSTGVGFTGSQGNIGFTGSQGIQGTSGALIFVQTGNPGVQPAGSIWIYA